MDRNTTIGFILITVILMIWIFLVTPKPEQNINLEQPKNEKNSTQSLEKNDHKDTSSIVQNNDLVLKAKIDSFGKYFYDKLNGNNDILTIETDKIILKVEKKGGNILEWTLKEFKTWNNYPVQLIRNSNGGDFNLLFNTLDGKLINTKNLYFNGNFKNGDYIKLQEGQKYSISLILSFKNDSSKIIREYTFENGKYSFESNVKLIGMNNIIAGPDYQVLWENHLNLTEYNSVDESGFSYAYAMYGDELIELDGNSFDHPKIDKKDGQTRWVSTRNKYFASAIITKNQFGSGYYLEGKSFHIKDEGIDEQYSIAIKMPYNESSLESNTFEVFIGPSDYSILKSYDVGLEKIISLGLTWLIRPISEYFMIPLFKLIHLVIPNYGLVIIVFTFIIRLLLHPLNKSQMDSMRKMQALQPMINEIREKYKDDAQKMNMQMMKLYKEYGVNPASGCLPLLLQMPILYALWAVFRSAIELRQASFVWWITDLANPDVILHLPFKIPIFGINQLSGLALMMGVTMFFQQKMSIKDPRQKAMVYLMPILFTLMFNNFPSGLNLYYFLFNLISVVQQLYLTKSKKGQVVLQKIPEKERKKGFMDRILEAQKAQQSHVSKKKK
ncbi:MAG TPA: membrane protein insertase YidC [Ignavibacteria bacterium]